MSYNNKTIYNSINDKKSVYISIDTVLNNINYIRSYLFLSKFQISEFYNE